MIKTASGSVYPLVCLNGWTRVFQFPGYFSPSTQSAVSPNHLNETFPTTIAKLSDSDISAMSGLGLWLLRCFAFGSGYYVDQYVKNDAGFWNSLSIDSSGLT